MQANTLATNGASTLAGQLSALQARVRSQSGDADLRAELFQLLVLLGDWPRARAQLDLCLTLNPKADSLVRAYMGALRAEEQRSAVFCGTMVPDMIDANPAMEQLARALACDAAGDAAGATALRARALDDLPPQRGTLQRHDRLGATGIEAFEWLADADNRLGPVLEVFSNDRYLWVPLTSVARIRIAPPAGQCDLVWAQASLTLRGGREQPVMIPARYCLARLAAHAANDACLRARETRWQPIPQADPLNDDTYYQGIGQRMWVSEQDEYAMLEIAEIRLEEVDVAGTPAQQDAAIGNAGAAHA